MFEDKNRKISDVVKNTADTISENHLEADSEEQKNSRYSHKVYKVRAAIAVVLLICFLVTQNWSNIMTVANYVGGLFSGGISNSEGITYFPEDYGEIYVQIEKLYGNGASDNKDDFSDPDGEGVVFPELEGFYDSDLFENELRHSEVIYKDGNYIYAVSDGNVYIISAIEGDLSIVSEFSVRENVTRGMLSEYSTELFVSDKYLTVIDSVTVNDISSADSRRVRAYIYDISDKTDAVLCGTVGQSGEYLTSWMVDDSLYIVSKHTVDKAEKERPETYVPLVYKNGEGSAFAYTDVCIYNNVDEPEYTVITGVDISKGGKIISNKALLGYGSSMYFNEKSLYITSNRLKTVEDKVYNSTDVTRFVMSKGEIKFKASANVPGFVVNKSGMSENGNSFRIVTLLYGKINDSVADTNAVTVESNTSAETTAGYIPKDALLNNEYVTCVYTLDKKLEVKGALENIFPGEPVYKTKFVKDMLYLTVGSAGDVYTVDLSNEKEPKLSVASINGYYPEGLLAFTEDSAIGLVQDPDGRQSIRMYSVASDEELSTKHSFIVCDKYDGRKYDLLKADDDVYLLLNEEKCTVLNVSEKSGFKVLGEIYISEIVSGEYDEFFERSVFFIDDGYLYVFTNENMMSFELS